MKLKKEHTFQSIPNKTQDIREYSCYFTRKTGDESAVDGKKDNKKWFNIPQTFSSLI